jgi:hypothetical protein
MPTAATHQRILVRGIPVLIDSERKYYYYETNPTAGEPLLCIGNEATGFVSNWTDLLAPRLATYRHQSTVRNRATKK